MTSTWTKGDNLGNRYNQLEVMAVSPKKGKKYAYKRYSGHTKKEIDVPRGTFLISLAERYFCQSIRPAGVALDATVLPYTDEMEVVHVRAPMTRGEDGLSTFAADVYFGPRDYFYMRRAGIQEAFPIGMLGQIGLILVMVLNWIVGFTKNYGVAIILLAVLITCALSPFTLIGFKSMRKMQELKPKVDHLMAKHKNDMQKANQEVLALYKEHKVSPLSGCLPLLLQMPIFIALFQAISHYVGLRGEHFLWISDLSLPDRLPPKNT